MLGTDYGWVNEQLDLVGYTDDVKENRRIRIAVLELFHTLDGQDPRTDEERNTIIELFDALGRGRQITPRAAVNIGARWTEFALGETRAGTTARVRHGAYEGAGAKHNGLVGTISAIRGGRVYIQYSGRNDGVGHAHHPDFVEVLAK